MSLVIHLLLLRLRWLRSLKGYKCGRTCREVLERSQCLRNTLGHFRLVLPISQHRSTPLYWFMKPYIELLYFVIAIIYIRIGIFELALNEFCFTVKVPKLMSCRRLLSGV
jgi:hypothetical protein